MYVCVTSVYDGISDMICNILYVFINSIILNFYLYSQNWGNVSKRGGGPYVYGETSGDPI